VKGRYIEGLKKITLNSYGIPMGLNPKLGMAEE
jgi:hypothetical protein